jgi:HlyD family secretion protein
METWSYRILFLVGAVALVFGVRAWLFDPEPVAVQVVWAEIGRVEETVTNSRAGTVTARQRAKLSAEIGGRVVAVPFEKGDRVKKGDILLRLNDASEKAILERTRGDLVVVKAQRNRACLESDRANREHARFLDLSKKELISIDELDRVASKAHATAAACQAMKAGVDRAKAAIQEARAQLDKTVLRAPFSGILGEVQVDVGEWITPAPPGVPIPAVIDLIDPTSIYISAPMDEVDSAKIHTKQEVRVTIDPFPGQAYKGHVSEVSAFVSDVEEQNRTVDIEVELEDRDFAKILLPGTSADVEVILSVREKVLRIPRPALLEGNKVWIVKQDRLVEQTIQVGLKNWDYVEVISGIQEGEAVVSSLDRADVEVGHPVIIEEMTDT